MAKRKGSSTSGPRTRSKAAKEAREVDNAQRLDKLPPEVWEKILDELDENDLFPLALSCRYFRQKQKELVERAWQDGLESGKSQLALKTNLRRKLWDEQPASADYLRFCSQEKKLRIRSRDWFVRYLAAFYGPLPLLQELLKPIEALSSYDRDDHLSKVADSAGESSFHSLFLSFLVLISDFFRLFTAWGGQLETLQWLKTQEGVELDMDVFAHACRGGQLEITKWLRSEGCPYDAHACSGAAREGHLDILKWLRSEGCPWNSLTFFYAAKGGHLDVLKYAHENGCPWDERTCISAAYGGHLDALKYLHENGCPWDYRTCSWAALGGHLDVLKYLHENGCPWDQWTCSRAAEKGHLDVLKYAHENGCPWDKETCERAARGGHLDVLKYVHENGCPWNKRTCSETARGGHLDVLKYAHENG